MRELPQFQVDAFASDVFSGNPAAVVPLDRWPDDELLQAIAMENNLSETAFFMPSEDHFRLRWFTPESEVNLCGHATLASAWVLFNRLGWAHESIRFETLSGTLTAARDGESLIMDFPAWPLEPLAEMPAGVVEGLGTSPVEVLGVATRDNLFAVYDTESEVRAIDPDFRRLAALHPAGVVITAPGDECDFVSRYFVPSYGIDEDPVTGSIHCGLTPYWSRRLATDSLYARQVSRRAGELWCTMAGDRVLIRGYAALFLEGQISVPDF